MKCPKCEKELKPWKKKWDVSIPFFFEWYVKNGVIYHCAPCHMLVVGEEDETPVNDGI